MNNFQLSYLLYNMDEVKYSLILSILFQKQHSLEECLFWAFEIYHSKYEEALWNILTQLYYDFYYVKNISFEKTLQQSYDEWKKTNDFQHIARIVKELHKQQLSTILFEPYYTTNVGDSIETTSNVLNTEPFDMLKSVQFLKTQPLNEILILYKKRFRVNKKTQTNCLFYTNQKHRWIVKLIAKLIKRKTMWIKTKLNNGEVEFIRKLQEPSKQVYKTLKEKRLFEINSNIGLFPLNRFNADTDVVSLWDTTLKKYLPNDVSIVESAYLHNWEYYARTTPIWKNIFKTYGASFKKKQIIFPDANKFDEFYDKYGFEPDEQSKETQLKSMKPIEKITIGDCFRNYNINLNDAGIVYSIA